MVKIIDPANLSVEDGLKLRQWFNSQNEVDVYYWDKKTIYLFSDGTKFQFNNKVIQRKRDSKKEQVRYEFISDVVIGKSKYAIVYEISGTLTLEPPNLIKYKTAEASKKTRVVKVLQDQTQPIRLKVEKEYKFSKFATHLAVKNPIIDGKTAYLVMRKMKGNSLFDIICKDLSTIQCLTLPQRIDLTIALSRMLKEQATDLNLIHRDVKPENIYVNLSEPILAQLFDYELSREIDCDDGQHPGSIEYAAPEQFTADTISVKTDVFGLGRVLALIWRVCTTSYNYQNSDIYKKNANNIDLPTLYKNNANNIDLSTLFNGIEDVSEEQKTIIRGTLKLMMMPCQKDRISIGEAISQFEKLNPSKTQKESTIQRPFFPPSEKTTTKTTSSNSTQTGMSATN